ncbi:SNF2-related protein [Helicobacter suis]|uniref:SNF2-related protein n=1 Tax=Helicobacter suis TaxID=104628 RepID=UPI0013D5F34A|nr:SNF2-related protein [Helicobacter suis]
MSFTERKSAFTHFKAQELQKHLTNKNIRLDQAKSLEKAYNPSTGNYYTDLHALALDAKMLECGYSKNQWISLNRARLLGADPKELAYIKANTRNKQNPQGSIEKVSISYLQRKDKEGNVLAEPIFNTTDLYNVEVFSTLDTSRFKEPNPQSLYRQEHSAQVRLSDLQNELKPEHYTQLQEYLQARAPAIEQPSTERVSEVQALQTEVQTLRAEVQRLQAEREADVKEHTKELEMLKAQNTAILEQLKQLVAQFAPPTQQERTATIQTIQENTTAENTIQENTTADNTIQENTISDNNRQENTIQENTTPDNTIDDSNAPDNATTENIAPDNTATNTEDTTPPLPNQGLNTIEQEERSAQELETENAIPKSLAQENIAVENSALENNATTGNAEQENMLLQKSADQQDFWPWQELLEEIVAESHFSYDKEKIVTLYGDYLSADFALMHGSDFFKADKGKQKEVLINSLNEFYFNNPYYLPVYTIPEKLEAICVSLEQGKSYLEDVRLRGQLLEVYKRHYYEVDYVGKEAISPITHPEFYTPMARVGNILAQIFDENREQIFIPDSAIRGALPLDELNEHLIRGLRIASMLYERDAYGKYRPFTPQPFAFDVDLQAAIKADSNPIEVLAQELYLSLENLAQDYSSPLGYYSNRIYSHVMRDYLEHTYKQVELAKSLESKTQNHPNPAPNESVISSEPVESTPLGEDNERSEYRGVYARGAEGHNNEQGTQAVVGETSPRVESTTEGLLSQSRRGGNERERRTLPRSTEIEYPNRLREGLGASRGEEKKERDRARRSSAVSGGNPEGDLSTRTHAHPSIASKDIKRENAESEYRTLGTTDVAIQPREDGGLRVFAAGSLESVVSQHDLSSAHGHSIFNHDRANKDGASDSRSNTGTDSARNGDNRYGDTPRSTDSSLSLFDPRTPQQGEKLQGVFKEGQRVNETLQPEPRGANWLDQEAIFKTNSLEPLLDKLAEDTTHTQEIDNSKTDFRTQEEYTPTTPKKRCRANIAAIKLLKQLEIEQREATLEEQKILSAYSGWGSMSNFFDSSQESQEFLELLTLLNPAQYYQARASTLDAYYTPKVIVNAIYEGLEHFGFNKDGHTKEIFEPSIGIGNFLNYAPLHANYHFSATEVDDVSVRIACKLHPNQNIKHMGFEKFDFTHDFDAFIGNPPYGDHVIFDQDTPSGASVHNYFVGKALKHLKEDGILAFVISSSFLDAKDITMREHIAKQASFLGAIRLPNNVFKGTGTEVTTDLVFFKKGQDIKLHQEFLESVPFYDATGFETKPFADRKNIIDVVAKALKFEPSLSMSDQPYGYTPEQMQAIDNFLVEHKNLQSFRINAYFKNHPEHVLGNLELQVLQRPQLTNTPKSSLNLKEAISSIIKTFPQDIYQYRKTEYPQELLILNRSHHKFTQYAQSYQSIEAGNFIEFEGEIYKLRSKEIDYESNTTNIILEHAPKIKTNMQKKRIQAFIPLRDALNDLLKAELNPLSTDVELETKRTKLNGLYEGFVKVFGYLNENKNRKDIKEDLHGFKVLGLEREFDKGINKAQAQIQGLAVKKPSAKKADIFNKRTLSPKKEFVISNAKEALIASVSETGGLDLAFMAKYFTTQDIETTLSELLEQKLIFKNHTESPSYVLASDYLSGNVKQKLQEVQQAIQAGREDLVENLKALEAVIPADIKAIDIALHLGTPWIPPKYYEQFLLEQVRENYKQSGKEGVFYQEYVEKCLCTAKNSRGFHVNNTEELDFLGIRDKNNANRMKMSGAHLLECVLNNSPLEIKYPDSDKTDANGKPVMVIDEEQTTLAQEKAMQVQEAFKEWIYSDYERRTHLEQIYNETFNTDVLKNYEGSHVHLEGFNLNIDLRSHQKNAIFRAIQERVVCLDHQVGAGKTLVAIASCMEQKRMGLINKSLIAVPNHLTKQWAQEFYRAYPNANLLVVEGEDFNPKNREQLYNQIANNNYDAVIIAHSQLEFLANPEQVIMDMWAEEEDELRSDNKALRNLVQKGLLDKSAVMSVRAEEQAIKRIGARYSKLLAQNKSRIDISQMGIDNLIVDEAHLFKNLGFSTNMQGVAGLGNKQGSKRATDLFVKTQYLHSKGAKIMFLTGTPIANSIAELYHLQRYLQPEELKTKGVDNFDDWAQTFGQIQADLELDSSAQNYKVVSRFSKFNNVQELSTLYRSFADVISNIDIQKLNPHFIPPIEGGKPINIVVPRSEDVARFIGVQDENGKFNEGSIVDRMEKCKGKRAEKGEDNVLACTTDARKAALDYRLIDPNAKVQDAYSKSAAMAEQIYEQYKESSKDKGTQLVFIGLSTPKVHSQRVLLEGSAQENGQKDMQNSQENIQENIQDSVQELLESLTEYNEQGQITLPSQQELESALEEQKSKALDLDTEVARNARFDVYSDVLRKLVNLGIPQSEIAFIHDAKSELQKQELFKKVNAGEVRVLLGSPAKMGVGTNVQERLVAGHFLDCPWRPDELLQMEGRLIRQGNVLFEREPEHFTIKLFRYATEQTYDSRMWQIIESKSKSLEQFRNAHKLGIRELEDISMGSADAGQMKALATGNPLIVQEVKLRQTLKREENLYKAFLKEQHFKQESLSRHKSILQHTQEQLDILNTLLELRESRKESVKIELYEEASQKQVFHLLKSDESSKQNLERIETLFKSLVQNALENEGTEIDVMGYRGLRFKVMCYLNKLAFYICHPDNPHCYIQPDNLSYSKDKQSLLDTGSFKDIEFKSFLRKCNHSLERLEKEVQREQEHLKTAQQEIKSLETLLEKTGEYPKLIYLQALKEDHQELLKEIAKCSADRNYKSGFVARAEKFDRKTMQQDTQEITATYNAIQDNTTQEHTTTENTTTDNITPHDTQEKPESKESTLTSGETNINSQEHLTQEPATQRDVYLEEIKAMNAFLIEEEARLRAELAIEEPLYESWMQKALEHQQAYWELWRQCSSIEFRIKRAEEGQEEILPQELKHLEQECTRLNLEQKQQEKALKEHVRFAEVSHDEEKLKNAYPRICYLKSLRLDHEAILTEIERTKEDPTYISTFRPKYSDNASWHAVTTPSDAEQNRITQILEQAKQRQENYKQERDNLLLGYEQNSLNQAKTEKLAKLMFEIAEPKLFATYNAPEVGGGMMKELLKDFKRCIEEGKEALVCLNESRQCEGLEQQEHKKKSKGRR